MKKCIFNGVVVGPCGLFPGHAVIIREDRIASIVPMNELNSREGEMLYFDARGGYIMPGFIDIHCDYIEGIVQPRPTCLMDFETSLRETEKQLVGHGVTMIFHSLSLMNSRGDKHSFRTRDNLERMIACIHDFQTGSHLIRHRFHARYEIDNLGIYDYLVKLLEEGRVHELSFMDHTPGQGQYRNLEIFAKSYTGWDAECSGKTLEEIMAVSGTKPIATHEMLKRLADIAHGQGIPLASHDDDTLEKLAFMKNEYGVNISEFPIELEVAKKAHAGGLAVVVGAPNVMLGGSHSGNLCAREAIREGCADILCSDYYPASLLHSAFKLQEEGLLTLPEAVRMLTLNPAKAMGLDRDFGSVEAGKKADLLVVRIVQGRPAVSKCFIGGRAVLQLEYRGGGEG
ncbi:MAG: alpha-D-ribose 1-methylphosphonate 5-triphosphate diphosphatase [Spirochaetales bacterium]|jgi:alpha-D-ribose 1-methylphosphonate 5-triphosphate diphosphatase|nr:alpha-D-ribose 1-methylphosphonate 5-triphosphate diphosphatase [Spirochaetales bacterium]